MGWFGDDSFEAQAYEQVGCWRNLVATYSQWRQVTNGRHEASWTHELIAGAASYEVIIC